MYKIKIYTHTIKININPSIPIVIEFMTRKIRESAGVHVDFSFDIEETAIGLIDVVNMLMRPLDGQYDVVMYAFDRQTVGEFNSHAFPVSPALRGVTLSTAPYDDAVGGTWMTIAHELMHTFFYKLKALGINTYDCMDQMMVNGVLQPYYKNWTPEASDGNFALAFTLLSAWWYRIVPSTATLITMIPSVTITRSPSDTKETLGVLTARYGNGVFNCQTLELPWLNNAKDISCIPPGTYQVKKVFWPRKLGFFYQVQNVPGRTGIFMHEGNYYTNYEGCIGLGNGRMDINRDGETDITETVNTVKAFNTFMHNEPFTLTIV